MPDHEWWIELCRVIDARDAKTFVSFLTDDCEFRFANRPPAVGHAAIGAAVDAFWSSIQASQHEVGHHWNGEDSGVCEGFCTYTRHDGTKVRLPFVDVLFFSGGKAAKYCIYMDVAPLYAQK